MYDRQGLKDPKGPYMRFPAKFKRDLPLLARLSFFGAMFNMGYRFGSRRGYGTPVDEWKPTMDEFYMFVPIKSRMN